MYLLAFVSNVPLLGWRGTETLQGLVFEVLRVAWFPVELGANSTDCSRLSTLFFDFSILFRACPQVRQIINFYLFADPESATNRIFRHREPATLAPREGGSLRLLSLRSRALENLWIMGKLY